jgi:hypothetical protein
LLYFAILLCFAFGLDDSALADSVGRVSKVQNQAQVGSIPAAVGTSVGMGDTLRTSIRGSGASSTLASPCGDFRPL